MEFSTKLLLFVSLFLVGCGGGSDNSSPNNSLDTIPTCPLDSTPTEWLVTTIYEGAECDTGFIGAGSGVVISIDRSLISGGCNSDDIVKLVDHRGCTFEGRAALRHMTGGPAERTGYDFQIAELYATSEECANPLYHIELTYRAGVESLTYNQITTKPLPPRAGECLSYSSYSISKLFTP